MSQRKFKSEDLRIRRTKRMLNAAFIKLLHSKDYSQMSVVEICEIARVHRATFYKHFKDKDDFLKFCIDEFVCKITQNIVLDFKDPNFKTNYLMFMKKFFDFIEDNRGIIKMLIEKAPRHLVAESLYMSILKIVKNNLAEKRKNEAQSQIPFDLVAVYYTGAIVSLFYWWALNDKAYTTRQMVMISEKFIERAMNIQ